MKKIIERILKIRNLEHILLILLIFTGFALRLYKINTPLADWHSFRQVDTASVSRMYAENGINLLYPKYHDISRVQTGIFNPEGYRFVEFPIYNAVHAILYRYIGFFSLEVWGRLLSIFSTLATAYLVFLLGKRYISSWGGLIATWFFLFLPYNVFFTRVILPEPMAVFFGVLSLYLFSNFLRRNIYSYLYFAALSFAISVLIKPYTIFYAIPMIAEILGKYKFKEVIKDRKFIFAFLIASVPLLLWRYWISQYPEGIPFWKWTFNGDRIRFKPAFWYWIFGERLTKLILGFGGIIPFSFGLMAYDRKNKFIHMFVLGMLFFVCVIATASVRHDYYQTITVPAIALMYAYGFLRIWNTKELNQRVTRGILAISVVMMLFAGAFQVKEFYKINHPEIIDAGAAVDRLTPKDSIVIAAYNGDTAFLYQTKRKGYPNVELPINELVEEGADYYVSVDLNDAQTKEFMKKFDIVEKASNYVILDLKRPI